MMKRKQKINTRLTIQEKKELGNIAKEWDISLSNVLRRLIFFLIQGNISVIDLVKKVESADLTEENFYGVQVTLTDTEKQRFINAIKEWDFSASAILRRLARALLAGIISKSDLW